MAEVDNFTKHVTKADDRFCFKFEYKNDSKQHSLKCVFEGSAVEMKIENMAKILQH